MRLVLLFCPGSPAYVHIVLHIGTDKTGSTSIQNALARNKRWLHQRGIFLPSTGFGRDNGHAALLECLEDDALAQLSSELQEAQDNGAGVALLCWEGMARYNKRQIRRLSAALADHEISVLVYLREQAEIIQSAHLQWIKMDAGALPLDVISCPRTPLQHLQSFYMLRHPRRNYHRLLSRWRSNLPGSRFAVRIFDRKRLHNGDVIADFLRQLGTEKDDRFVQSDGPTNPSIDLAGALLIQAWQRNLDYRDKVATLIDVTQSVINHEGAGERHFLREAQVATVRRHFARSNRRLAAQFMEAEAGSPFEPSRDCWRTASDKELDANREKLSHRVWEVNCVPTLPREAHGQELQDAVQLYEGWSDTEDWGVWSLGACSRLRFRLLARLLIEEVAGLRIHIHGHYHEGLTISDVEINGRRLGPQNLSEPDTQLMLPLDALGDYEVVDITLRHQPNAGVQTDGDARELAFALSGIAVELVRESG